MGTIESRYVCGRAGKLGMLGALLLCICAPASVADVELGIEGQLTPAPGTEGAETQAVPASGLFVCSVPFATVAHQPGGFAIGNCLNGSTLQRTTKSAYVATPPAGYFDGGYIDGAYDGCGWIFEGYSYLAAPWNATGCSPASRSESDFIARKNCASPCTDATPIYNPGPCHLYANFRPWSPFGVQSGFIREIPAYATLSDGSPRLSWRYVTRYPSADGWSGHWVMVRDRAVGPGQGNWSFAPNFCIGV